MPLNPKISPTGEILGLDMSDGSKAPSNTQTCTECWVRRPADLFGPTDDKCKDCREALGL